MAQGHGSVIQMNFAHIPGNFPKRREKLREMKRWGITRGSAEISATPCLADCNFHGKFPNLTNGMVVAEYGVKWYDIACFR